MGDTSASREIVARLRTELADVAGIAPVLHELERVAGDPAAPLDVRARVLSQLRQLSGDLGCFDAGRWIGVADLAVRAGRDGTSDRAAAMGDGVAACAAVSSGRVAIPPG